MRKERERRRERERGKQIFKIAGSICNSKIGYLRGYMIHRKTRHVNLAV